MFKVAGSNSGVELLSGSPVKPKGAIGDFITKDFRGFHYTGCFRGFRGFSEREPSKTQCLSAISRYRGLGRIPRLSFGKPTVLDLIYIYIYIYIEREREIERDIYLYKHMCIYIYIYVYRYVSLSLSLSIYTYIHNNNNKNTYLYI